MDESRLPLIAVGALVALMTFASVAIDPLAGAAALFGLIGVLIISSRPAYAVTLLLGSFLVTYPWWLQGRGSLTINNALAGWLALLMAYRIYRSGDLSIFRNRELQLLIAIAAVFLLSRFLYRPDDHTMELVTSLVTDEQDPARVIVNRLVFFIFLIYFVRTPQQVSMIFALAVGMMIASGFAAIWMVVSGGGFAGYRARSGMFIAAAGNPNRLALTAIISIISLWYVMQWLRHWLATLVISGIIAVEVLAVFMTGSRSGVVALLLGAGILFIEGGISPRKILLGLLATMVAAMLVLQAAPEKSLERISNIPGTQGADSDLGSGSVERRGYAAELALQFAESSPLIGVGIGNWDITRYLSDPVHVLTPPHSSVLMTLAEGGLITLGLYVILLARSLRNFIDSVAGLRGTGGWMLCMAKSLRASFLVFLAMSLVGDLWLNILFYWFVGLGMTLARVVFEPEGAAEPGVARVGVAEAMA